MPWAHLDHDAVRAVVRLADERRELRVELPARIIVPLEPDQAIGDVIAGLEVGVGPSPGAVAQRAPELERIGQPTHLLVREGQTAKHISRLPDRHALA